MNKWNYETPGIPDDMFERVDKVPITKEEVRTIQISKARLCKDDVVFDIGCGSGSIGIEAALRIGDKGRVYAIDHDLQAVKLTKQNLEKFGITNCTVIHGEAMQEIPKLPMANSIFIGGTGGQTSDIIKLCKAKLVNQRFMVIGTILVETLAQVLQTVKEPGLSNIDITQITIAKSRTTSTGTMMLARNPVTIISVMRSA